MPDVNIEPELKSLNAKLVMEIENDLKEIEVRKKRIAKNETLLRAVRGSLNVMHPRAGTTGYGAKSDIIRDAIGRLPKTQFIHDDVEAEIRRAIPTMEIDRSWLRTALWSMADKGQIKLIRKGTNKEPAKYEKIEGMIRYKRETEQDKEQTLRSVAQPQLTPTSFEGAVRAKGGRIKHFAKDFDTDEATVKSLLEPASKVYVSSGGWLRVRD